MASGDRQHHFNDRYPDAEYASVEISCAGRNDTSVPVVYYIYNSVSQKEERNIREGIQLPDHMCASDGRVLYRRDE